MIIQPEVENKPCQSSWQEISGPESACISTWCSICLLVAQLLYRVFQDARKFEEFMKNSYRIRKSFLTQTLFVWEEILVIHTIKTVTITLRWNFLNSRLGLKWNTFIFFYSSLSVPVTQSSALIIAFASSLILLILIIFLPFHAPFSLSQCSLTCLH